MILVGITDYNELLWSSQKCIKLFRFVLKIALTALVKYEIIGAGIVAVIWNYKIRQIALADGIQQSVFRILPVWTRFCTKAFITTATAWMNLLFRESKHGTLRRIGLRNIITDTVAVSAGSAAKRNQKNIHFYSPWRVYYAVLYGLSKHFEGFSYLS